MNNRSTDGSPERLLLTRLYSAQRRLRWARSLSAALRWFAFGSLLAAGTLFAIWNLNLLPGPWQWLASAGRPREVLWLPVLVAMGGFASRFFLLPRPRETAYRLDLLLDSQEKLLTAVDWIFSEKPRTVTSERLLIQASQLVEDERRFQPRLKELEPVSRRERLLPTTFLIPLLLVWFLPAHKLLPPDTSLWLGEAQVDQLTQDLLKELEDTGDLKETEEKLAKLLEQMEKGDTEPPSKQQEQAAERELQRAFDQLQQQAQAREKARELLETLSERARQNQELSEKDKEALEALRRKLADKKQSETLEKARQDWEKGEFQAAAEGLETVQKEMGESSQSLSEQAKQAGEQGELEGEQGSEFNENQGDRFNADGTPKDGRGNGKQSGYADEDGGEGEGEGRGPSPGKGTTLEEEPADPADGRQSLRRSDRSSDWTEEYKDLHPPERTEFQKAQTRVQGEVGEQGPRFRTGKEGLGDVTEPAQLDGSGGLLQYREEAENAILRDEVPADYRDNVRVYFESLDRKP